MAAILTHDHEAFPAAPKAGQIVGGRWRLDTLLGAGGMATVFEAHHRNGKRVAIKILRPELAHNDHALGRFLREGYLANAVGHPGAVSVLDDGITDDGLPFLVMEYLEGESLEARLTRLGRPLSLEDALAIGVAVLETLEAAQEHGIVHRDLKPENVFLCTDGSVKILDFGIARLREMPSELNTTQAGTTVGTPSFMAREQALGQRDLIDGRTDLWALGATLVYALTRRCVYRAPSVSEVMMMAATRDPPPASEMVPRLPGPIAAVIDRALCPHRARRWRTASEMKNALLAAAYEASAAVPDHPSQEGYVAPTRSRPPLVVSFPPLPRPPADKPSHSSHAPLSLPPGSSRPPPPLASTGARLAVAATALATLAAVAGLGLARLRHDPPRPAAPVSPAAQAHPAMPASEPPLDAATRSPTLASPATTSPATTSLAAASLASPSPTTASPTIPSPAALATAPVDPAALAAGAAPEPSASAPERGSARAAGSRAPRGAHDDLGESRH